MAIRALPLTEKAFLQMVRDAATLHHWESFHPFDSRHSPSGWPDLALCRPPRLVFAELKLEGKQPTPAQAKWLALLEQVPAVEVFLWRPSNWLEIMRVLQ